VWCAAAVGYFGDDDFNLGILLDGSCLVCGGRRSCRSNMAGSYAADLEGEDADEIPDEMLGWRHSPAIRVLPKSSKS
jgi:hypothetical protein